MNTKPRLDERWKVASDSTRAMSVHGSSVRVRIDEMRMVEFQCSDTIDGDCQLQCSRSIECSNCPSSQVSNVALKVQRTATKYHIQMHRHDPRPNNEYVLCRAESDSKILYRLQLRPERTDEVATGGIHEKEKDEDGQNRKKVERGKGYSSP